MSPSLIRMIIVDLLIESCSHPHTRVSPHTIKLQLPALYKAQAFTASVEVGFNWMMTTTGGREETHVLSLTVAVLTMTKSPNESMQIPPSPSGPSTPLQPATSRRRKACREECALDICRGSLDRQKPRGDRNSIDGHCGGRLTYMKGHIFPFHGVRSDSRYGAYRSY